MRLPRDGSARRTRRRSTTAIRAPASTKIAVTRLPAQDQAHRIGALFINYGGPGGDAVARTQAIGADLFGAVNDRFDLVAFDPRGVGQSSPSIDCKVNQETEGLYSAPFTTPENLDVNALLAKDKAYVKRCVALNKGILPYVSTANVARDMDAHPRRDGRQEAQLLRLLVRHVPRRDLLEPLPGQLPGDGARRPDRRQQLHQQARGEPARAVGRLRARARPLLPGLRGRTRSTCPFGGADPWAAYDALVAQANMLAIPADGFTDDPRPVNGDAILDGTLITLYRQGQLAAARAGRSRRPRQGDATIMRFLADASWGNNFDGTFDPGTDRYFTIGAIEQKYPHDIDHFLEAGDNSWGDVRALLAQLGYVEINYALWPIHDKDAFAGPFTASKSAPTVLEVATTYDPATPFRGAKRLATQLGNVRFLTMVGDGHTAYQNGSPTCIDTAIVAYIGTLALPPRAPSARRSCRSCSRRRRRPRRRARCRRQRSNFARAGMLRFRTLR